MIKPTDSNDLERVAACHISAFPGALSSALGKAYVSKMLGWYLQDKHRFLFHYEKNGEVLGYCGGIYFHPDIRETSASGMLRFSMKDALAGIIRRPWLLLHPELLRKLPLIVKNIKRAIFGVSRKRYQAWQDTLKEIEPHLGLIVIGVAKKARGQGIGSILLQEFEKYADQYDVGKLSLTVKSRNATAIAAYQKNGWRPAQRQGSSVTMYKYLHQ